MSFDDLVTDRIGFGRYQIFATMILVLIDLNDGVQLVLMSFINPILQAEWKISSIQVASLTSIFYLGTALGSCVTGSVADKYGRRVTIQVSSFMLFVVSIAFYYVNTVNAMAFVRLLYGFTYGFSLPLTTSMLSEIIPIQYRGKGLVFLNFFVSVGKIFGCLLAMTCLDSFSSGNWRLMMVLSAFPSLIVLAASTFYLYESPRFLMAAGQFEKSFTIINAMIQINGEAAGKTDIQELTGEEKSNLVAWSEGLHGKHQQASIAALFKGELLGITLRMWVCWFMENAMYFGQLVIIPFILGKSKKSFGNYIITVLGESPSFLVSLYMVDHPFLGRKNSLTLCFGLSMVFHTVCYMYGGGDLLSVLTSVARFFMKLCYAMLYPFSTELYPTLVRTVGFGMCGGIGRLGATLIPYLLFPLIESNVYAPFLVFAGTSFFAMISSYSLPYCTRGRQLDHIPEKNHPLPHHQYEQGEKHIEEYQHDMEMKLLTKN